MQLTKTRSRVRKQRDLAKSIVDTEVYEKLQAMKGYGFMPDILKWAKSNRKRISDVTVNRAANDGMATTRTYNILEEYTNSKNAA